MQVDNNSYLFTHDLMSDEEKEDNSEIFLVKSLPWRSNELERFYHSLDKEDSTRERTTVPSTRSAPKLKSFPLHLKKFCLHSDNAL